MGPIVWRLLAGGAVAVAGVVADKGLKTAWQAATGEDPPSNPDDPDVDWSKALLWGALSGAAIGAVRIAATRKAASYYQNSAGKKPAAVTRPR